MRRKRSENLAHPDSLEFEADFIVFLKTSIPKYIIYLVLSIFSLGIYPLVLSWTKTAKYWVVFTRSLPKNASFVLITTPDDVVVLCKLESTQIRGETQKFINFRFIRYFFQKDKGTFKKFNFFDTKSLKTIKELEPLTKDIEQERRL